jgi:lysophospholipase L1-like esterase
MKKLILLLAVFSFITSCSPKKLSWVAIGDSITYLNEHAPETEGRITKGYMTMVTDKLKNISYSNQGYSGWTSADIVDSINVLNIGKADIYSVFLGTNDWWQGRLIGTFSDYKNSAGNGTLYGSFRLIVDKLRFLNKDARVILITPMQRVDFVQVGNLKNNAWGSYRNKHGQSLSVFADAIREIGRYEKFDVIDLYNDPELKIESLVKFKRLKDPATSEYKNYTYPSFIDVPFNPETDEYPYPVEAMDLTYDGLHPSDKGFDFIARRLISVLETNTKR